jgi:hypothetical protein
MISASKLHLLSSGDHGAEWSKEREENGPS